MQAHTRVSRLGIRKLETRPENRVDSDELRDKAVGGKDRDSRSVTVRRFGSDKQEVIGLDDFVAQIAKEAAMP